MSDEEQYGVVGGIIKHDLEKTVEDGVNTVKQTGAMAKNVLGNLKEDIGNGIDWLKLSPQERAEAKQKEKEEAEAKQKEEEEAKEAEAERIKELEKTYILHTAVIICEHAVHESYVVLPVSHGAFIHGIPQLNIADSKPEVNIRSFGVCRSPKNPKVQEAAKKILDDINDRPKGFMDKVLDLFTKKSDKVCDSEESLAAQCAAECTPQIATEWIDGKEDVLVDGKPALLGKCTLTCGYGGAITIYTSGQME